MIPAERPCGRGRAAGGVRRQRHPPAPGGGRRGQTRAALRLPVCRNPGHRNLRCAGARGARSAAGRRLQERQAGRGKSGRSGGPVRDPASDLRDRGAARSRDAGAAPGPYPAVEVVHLFLEAPDDSGRGQLRRGRRSRVLERQLEQASAGLRAGSFEVSAVPQRGICSGCPAEAGLCSWPPELTRRPVAQVPRTPPPR